MPSLDEAHRSSSHGVAIPKCAHYHKPGSFRELQLHDPSISRGIQYWRCEGCSYVWVTIDGRAF